MNTQPKATSTPDGIDFSSIKVQVPAPAPAYGSDVSDSGKARSQRDAQAARDAGFKVKETRFEEGTLVNETGHKNYKRSHSKWESMPTIAEAAQKLQAEVKAEQRHELLVEAPLLVVGADGRISRQGGNGHAPMTIPAVASLATRITESGGAYLSKLYGKGGSDLAQAVGNLNYHLGRAMVQDQVATRAALKAWQEAGSYTAQPAPIMKGQQLKLRTRNARNGLLAAGHAREVFGVVGPQYTEHDVDLVAAKLAEVAGPEAKGEIRYDGYKMTADVIFHSNVDTQEVVCGEIFKAGVRVRTADDGSGSLQVQALVWRNLCLNLIIIDCAKVRTLRQRHIGEQADISANLHAGIEKALGKIDHFRKAWSEASLDNLLERYGVGQPQEIFEGMVANRLVWVPGVDAKEMVERLMAAWATEPGACKTNFVNAITKAAHTQSWERPTASEDLEERAGQLLFQKVWNVAMPEGVTVD